jgi:hypothetical protein
MGKIWVSAGFRQLYNFCLLPRCWEENAEGSDQINECTTGPLGRCRIHSFGMLSKPQAFPDFKGCISLETSQGQKLTGCLH